MKILSIMKGLRKKRYAFQLTPEEFSRLDILTKEAGVSKDEFLQILVDSAWKRKATCATAVDDFVDTLERFLDEKGEAYK